MAILTGQRETSTARRLVPFGTAALFALVSMVPLHLPGLAVITPAFALMAVYHWTLYRPDLLPIATVFALGILIDLLSGTSYVGLSALTLLIARTLLLGWRRYVADRAFPVVWGGFAGFAIGVLAFEWALLSILNRVALDGRPLVFQAVLTIACYPVGSFVLALAHRALVLGE